MSDKTDGEVNLELCEEHCSKCAKFYKSMEHQYHIVLENLFEPFGLYEVLYNDQGEPCDVRFLNVNPAYEEYFCFQRKSLIGKTFHDMWSDSEEWLKNLLKAAKTQRPYSYEGFSPECGNYMRALAFPIMPDRVAVLFLDISDIKRSEKALAFSKDRLHRYREELRSLAIQLSLSEAATKRNIATELHDRMGYSCVTLMRQLERAKEGLPEDISSEELDKALSLVENIIHDARNLTFQISSPVLYEVGLGAALKDLGENMFSEHQIAFSYSGKLSDQGIDDDICTLLFQMVKELFVNVIKHSGAASVSVLLRRGSELVRVVVEDDGVGFFHPFRKHRDDPNHFGLFSIRERLKYIGGTIEVYSEVGKGSTIYLTAPVRVEGGIGKSS